MSYIIIIILGIIEGITEWLPISSTGHLILFGNILDPGFSEEFMQVFNVVIQFGAILAVIVIFIRKLWPFHTPAKAPEGGYFVNPTDKGVAGGFQKFVNNFVYPGRVKLWLKIAVSSIPALIIGLLCEDWLEEHLHSPLPVAIMLILYGVIFIIVENAKKGSSFRVRSVKQITWLDALLIGCFQALALIPGTSRSGAIIVGALIIGLARVVATEYAFYLAIPAMAGASLIKLLKSGLSFSGSELAALLLGCAVAFIVSVFVIRFLMKYISNHDFKVFGYYRIVLGAIVIICAVAGLI